MLVDPNISAPVSYGSQVELPRMRWLMQLCICMLRSRHKQQQPVRDPLDTAADAKLAQFARTCSNSQVHMGIAHSQMEICLQGSRDIHVD